MKNASASVIKTKNLYRIQNTFCFPKITKNQYEMIKKQCEVFCDRITTEIVAASNGESFDFPKPKFYLNDVNIVSKYGDWLGPVIKIDDRYYRCIKKESIDKFRVLWKSGVFKFFSKKGYLPKLKISQYYSDEFPIIIELETLVITDITKLSLEQSKKGLLFVSLLQFICKINGIAIIDPHYFNYTFFENRYIYFDLGSFSTIDNYYKYRDYSMVVLGAYRILFSYFPDSIFSKQELGDFRYGVSPNYKTDFFEFDFYKSVTYKYCKKHCTKSVLNAFNAIFNNYECLPWDVITFFLPERINDVNNLLGEIM